MIRILIVHLFQVGATANPPTTYSSSGDLYAQIDKSKKVKSSLYMKSSLIQNHRDQINGFESKRSGNVYLNKVNPL